MNTLSPEIVKPDRVPDFRRLEPPPTHYPSEERRAPVIPAATRDHAAVNPASQAESEAYFRQLADRIPEVIWITGLEPERVLYVSPSFERIWGLPVEELYQNPRLWTEAIHPEDRERVREVFSRWISGESVDYQDVEFRIVTADGEVRWIHERGILTLNEHGKPCRVSGISTDITARKRGEEELRRSEACLAEAQNLCGAGSFGIRFGSRDLVCSEETLRHAGFDRGAKLTLEQALERVHPEDRPGIQALLERSITDGSPLDYEHRLLLPDGSIKHVHVVARTIRDAANTAEIVGAVMDITERKRAAEALRASEHLALGQVAALTRTLDALAQESDPDKLLEHVLRTVVQQTGAHSVSVWERNDDGGWLDLVAVIEDGRFQNRKDAIHPAARLPILALDHPVWSEVLRTGQHGVLEDIDQPSARMCVGAGPDVTWHRVLEDADPEPAVVLLKRHLSGRGVRAVLFAPMLIAGRVVGIIGIRFSQKRCFRKEEIELTRALAHQAMLAIQLMRLSRESRQAAVTAERNRMARDIHDTLAQGFTGVIVQLEAAADANSHGLAKEAQEHLVRAGELARDSLKEARRSVRALRPQALDEKDLCDALQDLIRKMTVGTSMRAEFSLHGQPPPLAPEWEESILRIGQEVLTNAIRHAHASQFSTKLTFAPNEIRLDLRDNGRGFDPATRHDGFGLLGIRERVNGMAGQIFIDSAADRGTAISIVLPLVDPARPSAA